MLVILRYAGACVWEQQYCWHPATLLINCNALASHGCLSKIRIKIALAVTAAAADALILADKCKVVSQLNVIALWQDATSCGSTYFTISASIYAGTACMLTLIILKFTLRRNFRTFDTWQFHALVISLFTTSHKFRFSRATYRASFRKTGICCFFVMHRFTAARTLWFQNVPWDSDGLIECDKGLC